MMNGTTRRLPVIAGIILYLVIVALVAFHYNFPYARVLAQAAAQVESQTPLKLDFGTPERKLPFRVHVPNVELGIAWPERTQPLLQMESVDLKLRIWALLLGQARVDMEGEGNSQTIHGQMVTGLFSQASVRVDLDEIDLPQFTLTDPSGKTTITGHLTGAIAADGSDTAFPENGHGRLVLEKAHITGLNMPALPIRDFDFDRIELEFELAKKDVTIKKLIAKGPQTEISLTGRIINYLQPNMDLNGSARLGPETSPIASAAFRLTGSPADPKVTITSGKGLTLPFPDISGN